MKNVELSFKKILGIIGLLVLAFATVSVNAHVKMVDDSLYTIKAYGDHDEDSNGNEDDNDGFGNMYEEMDQYRQNTDDRDEDGDRNRIMMKYREMQGDDNHDSEDTQETMDEMNEKDRRFGMQDERFEKDIEDRMEEFIKRMEDGQKRYMINLGRKIQDDIRQCREEYADDREKMQECVREKAFNDWKEHRSEVLENVSKRLDRIRERIKQSRVLSVAEKAKLLAKVKKLEQKVRDLSQKESITRDEVMELTKEIRSIALELRNEIRERAQKRVARRIDRALSLLEKVYERNKERFDTDTRAKLETALNELKSLANTIKESERPSKANIERFRSLAKEFVDTLKRALNK